MQQSLSNCRKSLRRPLLRLMLLLGVLLPFLASAHAFEHPVLESGDCVLCLQAERLDALPAGTSPVEPLKRATISHCPPAARPVAVEAPWLPPSRGPPAV